MKIPKINKFKRNPKIPKIRANRKLTKTRGVTREIQSIISTIYKTIKMLQMSSSTSDYERHKSNNNNSPATPTSTTTNGGGGSGGSRSSRNKKKGAPFMFFTNILKKKKVLDIDEIREMNTRTRSEPSGESRACNFIKYLIRIISWCYRGTSYEIIDVFSNVSAELTR